jgi:multidrug efflux pump
VLEWCLHYRKTVIAITLGIFVLSLLAFRLLVAQQFFPSSNRPELMVDLWLPRGASYAATEREVKKLEALIRQDKNVRSVTSYVGSGSPRFYLPLDQQQQHLNYAQLMVMTGDEHVRELVKSRIEQIFDHDFPLVRGRVTRLENGPPVGYPVQFRVMGPDHDKIRAIAAEVEKRVRANPATRHVNINWGEQLKALRITLDQDKIRLLGINSQSCPSSCRC